METARQKHEIGFVLLYSNGSFGYPKNVECVDKTNYMVEVLAKGKRRKIETLQFKLGLETKVFVHLDGKSDQVPVSVASLTNSADVGAFSGCLPFPFDVVFWSGQVLLFTLPCAATLESILSQLSSAQSYTEPPRSLRKKGAASDTLTVLQQCLHEEIGKWQHSAVLESYESVDVIRDTTLLQVADDSYCESVAASEDLDDDQDDDESVASTLTACGGDDVEDDINSSILASDQDDDEDEEF